MSSPVFTDGTLHEKCPQAVPLAAWCVAVAKLLTRVHPDIGPDEYRVSCGNGDFGFQALGTEADGQQQRLHGAGSDREPAQNAHPIPIEHPTQGFHLPQGLHPIQSGHRTPPRRPPPPELDGLTVVPELWNMSEAELEYVHNLKVGREQIGFVTFHGETDCRGLLPQLRALLRVEKGEVVVYPDAQRKPQVGLGLNKPASVVLYGCMPKTRLSDPNARERYKRRVAQMTEEKGAEFVDYDCEDGTWKFKVNHF